MIENTKLIKILTSRTACTPALEWLKQRNSDEMWTHCERPDWLLWWAGSYVPREELVWVACQCARSVLPHVPANESRPLKAIETAEAWTRGEATLKEVRRAVGQAEAAALYPASPSSAKAFSMPSFCAAVSSAHATASAAAYAAFAGPVAARAASAAVIAAASVNRAAVQAQMCEFIRQQWPICPEPGVKG